MNAIEMKNITMAFGNFKANDDVSLEIKKGEVHALIGENGAGKSTLMSILFGLYNQTAGTILVNNKNVNIDTPLKANELGIGMVHQHFKLVEEFTVLENIVLNKEKLKYNIFLDYTESIKKINEIMNEYNFHVDLDKKIYNCTVAEQQRVEIIKMLYGDADILIFDEPTAVLSPQQIDEFLNALNDLRKKGKTIILISHKLDELKKVADRGTVIRRGKVIGTVDIAKVTHKKIAELMVGTSVEEVKNSHQKIADKVIFEIKDLSVKKYDKPKVLGLKNFNLKIKEGEIVSIVGVEGNGQTELINSITGLQTIVSGEMNLLSRQLYIVKDEKKIKITNIHKTGMIAKLNKFSPDKKSSVKKQKWYDELKSEFSSITSEYEMKPFHNLSISKKYRNGMSHIPEDRHKFGLVLGLNLEMNAILQDYNKWPFSKLGILKFGEIKKYANELIDNFDVRSSAGSSSITNSLSGGNQQKFIVARELSRDSKLLIIAQPTRGLDVGAINNIHSYILKSKNAGKAILLLSYELDEVLALSDRMIVLNSGELVGELNSGDATKQKLGALMASKAMEGGNNLG